MRALRLLSLRHLRRHPLRLLVAVVAVAAGTSLAASVAIVRASVPASVAEVSRALAGPAPLRVVGATSRGGLEQSVEKAVARTPGVKLALGMVQATTLVGPDTPSTRGSETVLAIGLDCTGKVAEALPGLCMAPAAPSEPPLPPAAGGRVSAGPGLPAEPSAPAQGPHSGGALPGEAPLGQAPPGSIYVSPSLLRRFGARYPGRGGAASRGAGVRPAPPVLRTDLGVVPLSGAPVLPALDHLDGGRAVLMPLAESQALFDRPGLLDVVYVLPAKGTSIRVLSSRLSRVVGRQDAVLGASVPPPAVSLATGSYLPLLTLIALLAAAVAGVLVYDVVALSLQERRRHNAIAAALGVPRLLLASGPLIEAGVIGVAGGLGGVAAGALLARPVVAPLSAFTSSLAGVPIGVHVPPSVVAEGAAFGLVVALAAAALPLRRALVADVVAELSEHAADLEVLPRVPIRRGLGFALLSLVGLAACWLSQRDGGISAWQLYAGIAGFLVLIAGLVLAVGAFTPAIAWSVRRCGLPRRAMARLGLANLVRHPARSAVMAIALAGSVGVAVMTSGFTASVQGAIAGSFAPAGEGRVRVSAGATGNGIDLDSKVPPSVLARLGRLPGVAAVDTEVALLTGNRPGNLVGVVAYTHAEVHGPVLLGTANQLLFERGEVMIGAGLARRRHLRPGSRVRLDTPSGLASVPVQGVWNDGAFAGSVVTMPMAELVRLYGPQPPTDVLLVPARGKSPASLAAEVRRARLAPYLRVATPAERAAAAESSVSAQLGAFWALQRALVVVAFVAVLSTLLLAGVMRQRELATLVAVGVEPRQVFSMVLAEAGAVGVIGALLGIGFGVAGLAGLLWVAPLLLGYADPYVLDPASMSLYALLGVAVALVAGAWPAWRASRVPVLDALHDD